MQAIKMAVGLNALRAHGRANAVRARGRVPLIGPRPSVLCQNVAVWQKAVADAQKLVAFDVQTAQVSSVLNADKQALASARANLQRASNALQAAGYRLSAQGQCVAVPSANRARYALPTRRPFARVGDVNQFATQADKDAAVAADTTQVAALTAQVSAETDTANSLQAAAAAVQAGADAIPQSVPGTADDPSQQSTLDGLLTNATDANNASTNANTQLLAAQSALSDAQTQLATDEAATIALPDAPPPANPPVVPVVPVVPIVPPPAVTPSAGMSSTEKIALALVAAAVVVGGVAIAGKKKRK
jgi:hypothetical protein